MTPGFLPNGAEKEKDRRHAASARLDNPGAVFQ
jgi:hypothetical protein